MDIKRTLPLSMNRFLLFVIFFTLVFPQNSSRYSDAFSRDLDNIMSRYIIDYEDSALDIDQFFENNVQVIDEMEKLGNKIMNRDLKKEFNGSIVILKMGILHSLGEAVSNGNIADGTIPLKILEFAYQVEKDLDSYSTSISSNFPKVLNVISYSFDNDSSEHMPLFLAKLNLMPIILWLDEDYSSFLEKKYVLFQNILSMENADEVIMTLNAISSMSVDPQHYLLFQEEFMVLLEELMVFSIGSEELIIDNYKKFNFNELMLFLDKIDKDIINFMDGNYDIKTIIGDNLDENERIKKFGFTPRKIEMITFFQPKNKTEYLLYHNIRMINFYTVLATLNASLLGYPDLAESYLGKSLNVIKRTNFEYGIGALLENDDISLDVKSYLLNMQFMGLGKTIKMIPFTFDLELEDIGISDIIEKINKVCKPNSECDNISKFGVMPYSYNFMLGMVEVEKLFSDYVKNNNNMVSSLEEDERYYRLMFQVSSDEWTEEDEDYIKKITAQYFNQFMPPLDYYFEKTDSIIENIFLDFPSDDFAGVQDNLIETMKLNFAIMYNEYASILSLDVSKDIKSKTIEQLKKQIELSPKDPISYTGYYNEGLTMIAEMMYEEEKDLSTKSYSDELIRFSDELYNTLEHGFYTVFEDITVGDIQLSPDSYSMHMLLAKLYNWAQDGQVDEVCEESSECLFDVKFRQILIEDKINSILYEENASQSYLDYHKVSDQELNEIFDWVGTSTRDIIIYRIRHDGLEYEDYLEITILQKDEDDLVESSVLEKYILGSEIDVENFFYDESGYINIQNRITIFEKALGNDITPVIVENMHMFYKWLFEEIEQDYELKEDLLIIPDSILSGIPFGILIDKEDNLLLEKYNIAYSNSLSDLTKDLQKFHDLLTRIEDEMYLNFDNDPIDMFESAMKENYLNILALGDIDYSIFNDSNDSDMFNSLMGENRAMNNLEWARDEIMSIKSIFKNQSIIKRNRLASESFIKNFDFSNTNILHLSTHGILNIDNYNKSSIVLYPDKLNDGFLAFDEIINLDLTNLHLVFLSACETNRGKKFKNIDTLSLQKAFNIAGASHIISTLWPVEDKPTYLFTEIFYRNLLSYDPFFMDLALAESKLEFAETYPEYLSPYYWAAFVIYGY